MPVESIETTPEDFELFKAECKRWIEFWGLYDWEVVYEHIDIEGCVGRCVYDATNKIASIKLALKFPVDDLLPFNIKHTAFHEVDELRLATAQSLATNRFTSDMEIEAAFHAIIRQDENKIFMNTALNLQLEV